MCSSLRGGQGLECLAGLTFELRAIVLSAALVWMLNFN